jgi:hypothetical protein
MWGGASRAVCVCMCVYVCVLRLLENRYEGVADLVAAQPTQQQQANAAAGADEGGVKDPLHVRLKGFLAWSTWRLAYLSPPSPRPLIGTAYTFCFAHAVHVRCGAVQCVLALCFMSAMPADPPAALLRSF